MMKFTNLHKLCATLLVAAMLTGCKKDFLNQVPEANLTNTNFWKTESDLKQGVVGAYSSLRGMGTFSYWLFGEMRSDNTTFQYNAPQRGQENREQVDQFLATSANTLIQDFWRESYTAIFRCNDVLDHVEAIAASDAAKKQAVGETKFLRAFYYFNLVRQFGGVPLRLEVTKTPTDAPSKGRATADQVYAQIVADLNDAVTNLPDASAYGAADKGRASKGSAHALLGKVYMTQRRFPEALVALRRVTGYGLMPTYSSVFSIQNKNNMESVFEIQYYVSGGTNLSSNFMYQFAPFNSGTIVTQDPGTNLTYTSGWNTPTADLIASYEAGDQRKDVSLAEGFTAPTGFVAVPYVKKYNQGFVQPGQTNVNFPVIRYADVMLMMAECLNEAGFVAGGEAFQLLNEVRRRAGLAPKTSGNPVAGLNVSSQEAFRAAIEQERKIELAFENHRWYDLVRTGRAVEVMNAHGQREVSKAPAQFPAGAYAVTPNKLLLPIPQREVILDNLSQNPQ
ncbi:RagB/SusD family nutrient uptake outer membrane protein [Pedobacter yulinensis]|uniref:RagB/SusD family nutrient uptake outer membrane protein n=1 Tax=Pedobacter yulinensis TaxID=2126353 RepID=A0A2T3HMN4_9SPHI|nr:RagB/SusD family nutrient uptake outer membrane protein [Pedobacter yulinensis]PST83631.1 RagB/SusD family nutrient uptake outer membrane protein [Pedobacter yulinensis]